MLLCNQCNRIFLDSVFSFTKPPREFHAGFQWRKAGKIRKARIHKIQLKYYSKLCTMPQCDLLAMLVFHEKSGHRRFTPPFIGDSCCREDNLLPCRCEKNHPQGDSNRYFFHSTIFNTARVNKSRRTVMIKIGTFNDYNFIGASI